MSLKPSGSDSGIGNSRNKVKLKPGHSHLDWIRLKNSGKDLTGVGGSFLDVTKAQLAEHCSINDAWISLRGKVFNITEYMDYHPGGSEELMRGAGIDATSLFDQIHRYVNYEYILEKCLIGRMVGSGHDIFTMPESTISATSNMKIDGTESTTLSDTRKPNSKVDWFQQLTYLTLVFYIKPSSPQVHISLNDAGTELCVGLNNFVRTWQLERPIAWPCGVLVSRNKVELKFTKSEPGDWSHFGTPCVQKQTTVLPDFWPVKVVASSPLTPDTKLISLDYVDRVFNYVPVGHHVMLKAVIADVEVTRPYTPVVSVDGQLLPSANLSLIVKAYTRGSLSEALCSGKCPGVSVSQPQGTFQLPSTARLCNIVLMAAGSGLTPMASLIGWALSRTTQPLLKVKLVFFNRRVEDIIWRKQLDGLMLQNPRFAVEHVLSEACASWNGQRGHVSLQLLQSILSVNSTDARDNVFIGICGPTPFTLATERYLKTMGYSDTQYYCFLGQ